MSKKSILKQAIEDSEAEIEALEKKRNRSQSAILDSYINQTKPNKSDVEYFRLYSSLIEVERENLRKLKTELTKIEEQ